ncbi:MAG TPA: FAD-binding oxidoreductase [Methylomirabilota bacterium]|nr:FAD-binding oxidoreductase [Methylomirabilota bacterium]
MAVSMRSVGAALADVVGAARVTDHAAALRAAAVDDRVPRWVVRPASAEQVATVLALAAEERLAVIPRGSGAAMDLGAPPARLDLVLDTKDLVRVLDYQPDDLTVSVEVGVSAGALATELRPRRQQLPVDPPGWETRTLGGLVATNAHGPLRARYGTLRDLLLGVRFVQADGVLTWGGARVVKSVSGYDVPKLMVGALGTLGVLVELTLRLHPVPDREGTWLATLPSAAAAQSFIGLVLDSTLEPTRLELLNEPALRACQAPPAPFGVAVSLAGVEAAVRDEADRLQALARGAGGHLVALDDGFWPRYDRALARAEGEVVLQLGVLPSRIADTLDAITAAHAEVNSGATPRVAGCAASGSLRLLLPGAGVEDAASVVTRLRAAVGGFDGSVVVQAGPRALRATVDPWGAVAPAALELMRRLRDEFDPGRVLNPGRFVGGL